MFTFVQYNNQRPSFLIETLPSDDKYDANQFVSFLDICIFLRQELHCCAMQPIVLLITVNHTNESENKH